MPPTRPFKNPTLSMRLRRIPIKDRDDLRCLLPRNGAFLSHRYEYRHLKIAAGERAYRREPFKLLHTTTCSLWARCAFVKLASITDAIVYPPVAPNAVQADPKQGKTGKFRSMQQLSPD